MAFISSRKHGQQPWRPGSAVASALMLALPAGAVCAADTVLPTVKVEAAPVVPAYKTDTLSSPKYTAPLLDTPKTIAVIPSEVIEQSGAVSLAEALRATPGITMGSGEGGNPIGDNIYIRGFMSQSDTFVDGVRDSGSQSREVFNLEQVEVSKGPGSAYGGRGSAGGSVNLVSKAPKLEEFTRGSLGVGTDDYRRGTLDINRTLDDTTAFRLNAMAYAADVAGRDAVNYSRWGIAPSVGFGLGTDTSLVLSYYHMQSDDLPDSGIPFNNPFSSGSNVSRNGDGQPVSVDRNTFYGLVNRDFHKTEADIATIDAKHTFGNGMTLRNVMRYGKTTNDYVWTQPDDSKGNVVLYGNVWRRTNSRITETETATNQTSLDGKIELAGIQHSYVLGLELSREETNRGSYVFSPGTNNLLTGNTTCASAGAATGYNCTTLNNPNPNDPWVYTRSLSPARTSVVTTTQSLYGFDTAQLNERWSINGGLRLDDYTSKLHTPAYVSGSTATAAVSARTHSQFWNYQAGVVYKPVAQGSVYASYGTASTPPGNDGGDGLDGLTAAVQNLDPQESRNIELGIKWELFDRALQLAGAVFDTDMKNARVTSSDGTSQNVGRKRVKGYELSASGNIGKNWQVFAGYTHLNARVVDNGFLNVGTTAAPVYVASPYNGNRFPTTPEDSLSLWSTYTVLPGLTVGGGASYVSKVYANVNNTKWVPSYWRYDAMASYTLNKHTALQLNIQNLTDKVYYNAVSSPHYANIAPGRSATLTANFMY